MKESLKTTWLNDLAFEIQMDGHKIYIDTSPEHGGKNMGMKPKALMMAALAGCTAMDVVSILKKMREQVEEFHVEVEGDMAEEHPKKYLGMKIIYRVKGTNVSRKNVEKAVKLSSERYCGVSANYRESFPVEHEIVLEES